MVKEISKKYCPRFGQTAVEMGFITADILKEAISIQVDDDISLRKHRLLGAILFEKDWMSSDQIESVLNLMLKQMRKRDEVKLIKFSWWDKFLMLTRWRAR